MGSELVGEENQSNEAENEDGEEERLSVENVGESLEEEEMAEGVSHFVGFGSCVNSGDFDAISGDMHSRVLI